MTSQQEPVASATPAVSLRITDLAAGGDGVGRLDDGRVVFVEGGVPGDRVELAELSLRKRLGRARIGRILEASRARVEPKCAHFDRCGGCLWQHIDYTAQLQAKRGIVRDSLERIGGIALEHDVEIVPSPDPYGYRARARLVSSPAGLGYRRRGSHEIEAIRECPILVPSARAMLRERIEARRDPPPSEAASRGRNRSAQQEWEILSGSQGPAVFHRVGAREAKAETIEIEVLGERLRASPGSFVQGNALLWDALAAEVRTQSLAPRSSESVESGESGESVAPVTPGRLVELHAGIGFLTLPLARSGWTGFAFESGRAALRDLAANLGRAGMKDRIEVIAGRVERRGDWAERFASAELLLLDPPRVGLDAKLRECVARAGPERVVYVSCDPATLARDLREILAGGYRLGHLRAFDLFPQTPHVEVVVRLDRVETPARRSLVRPDPD
jgi:23S rRNA (uracil1939-C5)-methyltransferase